MDRKFSLYIVLSMLAASLMISCNDDSGDPYVETLSSSTAVTAFSLVDDNDVMDNLDSVFFTIDLKNAEIYNADSLPMGTDVSRLRVSMTYAAASSATFTVTGGTVTKDKTFSYSDEDSIDFTGDVKFTIVSQDLTARRTYSIKVNVHKVEPDSLYWNRLARRDLPSYSSNPLAQKTVQYKGEAYCLIKEASSYVLSTSSDLGLNRWTKKRITLPFVADVKSFTAAEDALYILDNNKALYKSADGENWTACGTTLYSIIGSYGSRLLGVVKENGVFKHTEYPMPAGYDQVEVDASFPVEGVSQMVTLVSKWAISEQKIVVGGKTASGSYSGATWGFDGETWGMISRVGVPAAKDVTLVSYYYTYLDENNITSYQYPALLVMGGVMEDGSTLNDKVYISSDNGLKWAVANEALQLPEYIERFSNAQALVYNSTLTDARSSSTGWIDMPASKLPASLQVRSRAVEAVTSWECPYIYLFGGTNVNGALANNIWRGAINRLTFKPLY